MRESEECRGPRLRPRTEKVRAHRTEWVRRSSRALQRESSIPREGPDRGTTCSMSSVSGRFLSRACPRKSRDTRDILPTSIERDVTFILLMGAFLQAIESLSYVC